MIRAKYVLPKLPKLQPCWVYGRKKTVSLSVLLLVMFSLLLIPSDCQITDQQREVLRQIKERQQKVPPPGYSQEIQLSNCSTGGICSKCLFQFLCDQCNGHDCCPKHCLECLNTRTCTYCEEGYKLTNFPYTNWRVCIDENNDSINRDPNDPQKCADGYYLLQQTKECYQCQMPQCKLCSNYNNCYQCINGYYISYQTHQCEKCILSNCLNCSPTGFCQKCTDGFKIDKGICHKIDDQSQPVIDDPTDDQTENKNVIVIDQSEAPQCPPFNEIYLLGLTLGICAGACCKPLYQKLKLKFKNFIQKIYQKLRNWFFPEDPQQEIELNEQIEIRDDQVQKKSSKLRKPINDKNSK